MVLDYAGIGGIILATIAVITPVYRWVTSHQEVKRDVSTLQNDVKSLKAADERHAADTVAIRADMGLVREGMARVEAVLSIVARGFNIGGDHEGR